MNASHPNTFRARDPRTGEFIGPVFETASSDQINAAAESAAATFRHFCRTPGSKRAQFLRSIAKSIESLGDTLIECATHETALPPARLINERARTCAQLRLFADLVEADQWRDERIDPADPSRTPQPRPHVHSLLRPLGPIAVFGASNFPLAFSVAGGDTAAALAVGCPVIVKAHPTHPGTSFLVAGAIESALADCNLPAGVFTLLFDEGRDVGLALVQHPAIKAGAFTGSRQGGLALWRAAQSRPEPIPFFAEMSSVNPIFLLDGILHAQADAIATGLHAALTLGVGQFCTQPGILFLQQSTASEPFLQHLARLVQQTPPGTMLAGPMRIAYELDLNERCALRNVQTLARVKATESTAGAALLATDTDTFLQEPSLSQEVFGPATLAVRCSGNADFLRCAEHLDGQLTATLWALPAELPFHADLLWLLEQRAGRLVFNGFPTGVEVGSATMHGGPFPATTDGRFTSVGTRAIQRFLRPIAYQMPTDPPPEMRSYLP